MNTVKGVKWIDVVKFIAVICVIAGSCLQGTGGFILTAIAFAALLFICGYTQEGGALSLKYADEKFRRLMPPYFITCFIILIAKIIEMFFIDIIRSVFDITQMTGNELLKIFFASYQNASVVKGSAPIDGIGWICLLPAVFFALILFSFLSDKIKSSLILGAVMLLIGVISYASAFFIHLPFSIQAGLCAAFIIWIGYSVKKMRVQKQQSTTATLEKSGPFFLTWPNIIIILCVHFFSTQIIRWDERLGMLLHFLIELAFVLCASAIIFIIKSKVYKPLKQRYINRSASSVRPQRDTVVDIARGLLIIIMLIGHFQIAEELRTIIYSFHMIAFVFLSGYFYKKSKSILRSLGHMARTFLLPYAICVIAILLLHIKEWSASYILKTILTYVLGFSFSDRLLPDIGSVGPIYFILLLFVVRLAYMLIDRFIKSEAGKWIAVIICTALGLILGVKGYWLPWSIDVALYCMVFYKAGISFKRYGLLDKAGRNHWAYFCLAPVWAFMIYKGSMEIAIRNYGTRTTIGLVVLGAICGTVVIYILSSYISGAMIFTAKVLDAVGEASLIILALHTIFNSVLNDLLGKRFASMYLPHMVISILIQIAAGTAIYLIIKAVKKKIRKAPRPV